MGGQSNTATLSTCIPLPLFLYICKGKLKGKRAQILADSLRIISPNIQPFNLHPKIHKYIMVVMVVQARMTGKLEVL